jgi:hypothetical protein
LLSTKEEYTMRATESKTKMRMRMTARMMIRKTVAKLVGGMMATWDKSGVVQSEMAM